jgi:hypothetical protein
VEDLAETIGADAEGVRADVGQFGLDGRRCVDADLGALLVTPLGENERRTVLEGEPEAGVFGCFSPKRR